MLLSRHIARLAGSRVLSARTTGAPVLPLATRAARPSPVRLFSGSTTLQKSYHPAVAQQQADLAQHELFSRRHIGTYDANEQQQMLRMLDPPADSVEEFLNQVIPPQVRRQKQDLDLVEHWDPTQPSTRAPSDGIPEHTAQRKMRELATLNTSNSQYETYIGCGYYGTVTPEVIKRNVLESPAWYTSYTPYQAEISQGRLESLLNFQTMVTEMTGMDIANASVLDEATAAAEAMTLAFHNAPAVSKSQPKGSPPQQKTFVVSNTCHPQTIAVLESRAQGFGINLVVGDVLANDCELVKHAANSQDSILIGTLVQYPDTRGGVFDYSRLADLVHSKQGMLCVATDLLALTLLKSPGEFGADIAFGSAQRLGVPLGYGGPHAAFFACSEKYRRKVPGRLVGVSKDRLGNRALRLALQTREQHIRREKATSNICTAQALLANISAFYAIYHGPEGLRTIARDIWGKTRLLQALIAKKGVFSVITDGVRKDGAVLFDTLGLQGKAQDVSELRRVAKESKINLRYLDDDKFALSLHEGMDREALDRLLSVFGVSKQETDDILAAQDESLLNDTLPDSLQRTSSYLQQPVFNEHHTETELVRYIYKLQNKDVSLVHSMIPLGSCTMKLNATTEMLPLSDPNMGNIHPFAPAEQAAGYEALISSLSNNLAAITDMDQVSLQPNSGAQGEFAGLRVIKAYHASQGASGAKRNVCLIPVSAHGTNPASAAMAGMKVVPLKCDTATGNLDLDDLRAKCATHADSLAAIMITYPSTYGVFEPEVRTVCNIVHAHGGQVYMDGANLNAQIGLTSPGDLGADVCHLNLHKTFCIPHGGGGPGVGPIAVKQHLAPFLPTHPFLDPQQISSPSSSSNTMTDRSTTAVAPISAAPFGSASILPISHIYTLLMGPRGLTRQTTSALLNANYILSRLRPHYTIAYTNAHNRCAHEFILDVRPFKASAGVEAVDIAKRLQDYGFHAPTMSWPIVGTLMIEPTESESRAELDRYCDALISIRGEIRDIEEGRVERGKGNLLTNAPHPLEDLLREDRDEEGAWEQRSYSREQAAYPLPWLRNGGKVWPSVARVDDKFGDSNLFCTCDPVGEEE